jgi:hypothetical protein
MRIIDIIQHLRKEALMKLASKTASVHNVSLVVGEDYAGFPSSGTPVVTATNSVPVGSGEAFYGFQPATAPDARKATVALDLKLTRPIAPGSDVTPSFGN